MNTKPLLFLLVAISSCSMNYSDAEIAEKIGENIPTTQIENFTYTNVNNGMISFRLFAKKAANYVDKKETVLNDVVFNEYNSKTELVTEGTVKKGVVYTESDNAELTGSLRIYSVVNEAEIISEYLYWEDATKTLTGSDNKTVKLLLDSGTEISGTRFHGNLDTKIFNFDKDVNGIYHYEED